MRRTYYYRYIEGGRSEREVLNPRDLNSPLGPRRISTEKHSLIAATTAAQRRDLEWSHYSRLTLRSARRLVALISADPAAWPVDTGHELHSLADVPDYNEWVAARS